MKYILDLSNKKSLILDDEDFEKFKSVSGSGNFVKLKQGIVNPSFVISIIPMKGEKPKLEGYIDEETRKFIVTSEVPDEIPDDFNAKEAIQKLTGGINKLE